MVREIQPYKFLKEELFPKIVIVEVHEFVHLFGNRGEYINEFFEW